MEKVKERIVYPRVGYYRERSDDAKETSRGMLTFIGGAFLLMVLVVVSTGELTDPAAWRRAAPLLSGLSLAGGFWYAGAKSGLLRFRLISGWSVVSAIAVWLFGTGVSYSGVVLHLLSLALPLAIVGVWSLITFVREHPVRDG